MLFINQLIAVHGAAASASEGHPEASSHLTTSRVGPGARTPCAAPRTNSAVAGGLPFGEIGSRPSSDPQHVALRSLRRRLPLAREAA
jgi:hypothetical protein